MSLEMINLLARITNLEYITTSSIPLIPEVARLQVKSMFWAVQEPEKKESVCSTSFNHVLGDASVRLWLLPGPSESGLTEQFLVQSVVPPRAFIVLKSSCFSTF